MKKIHTMADYTPAHQNDRRYVGLEDVVHYQTIMPLRHLSFDTISSIQFCVDGARGLPASVSATRVTARLLSYDRTQVGEPSAPSYSNPDSDACNPKYDLHMGWRGNVLIPSVTVVCRIDTLEKPNLLPKCVGFAVMKLCVDMNGSQPKPEMHPEDRVYLNAGQYLLPIVYGTVPTNGPFTEDLMDSLPHIHNAYLAVRLFDPSVDVPQPPGDDEYMPYAQHVDYGKYVVDNSVAGALVHAMPYSDPSIRKIPISEFILDEIQRGEEIGEGEKRVVLRQCLEWMAASFPPLKSKLPLIDARFMLPYEDRFGVFCALDMLYRMPQKPNLLGVTKRSLGPQSIFATKKYDNKIRYFKSYFRYLPGFIPKKQGGSGLKKEDSLADMIIDDASLDLNLGSPEFNPIFNDDFSRTVGIELTQNACLLVVISAIDILTSKALANQTASTIANNINGNHTNNNHPHHNDFQYYNNSNASPSRNGRTTAGPNNHSALNGFASTPDEHFRRNEEEKGFKLRGLRGIYFNENHVDSNGVWWGIIPLLIESPFEKDAKGNKIVQKPVFSPMKALKATAVTFSPSSKNLVQSFDNNNNNNADNNANNRENGELLNGLSPAIVKKLKDTSSMVRSSSSKKMLANLGKSKSNNRIAIKRDKSNNNLLFSNSNNNQSQWLEVNNQDMDVTDLSPENSFRDNFSNNNNNYSNRSGNNSRVATGKSTGRSSKNQQSDFNNNNNNNTNYPTTSNNTSNNSSSNNSRSNNNPSAAAAIVQAAMQQAHRSVNSVNNGHWFVNAGTHQVPLFAGLPPEELFLAANPMAWVLAQLAHLPSPTELATATTPLPHATSVAVHSAQQQEAHRQTQSVLSQMMCCTSHSATHAIAHTTTNTTTTKTAPTAAAESGGNGNNNNNNSNSVRRAGGAVIAGGTSATAQPVAATATSATTAAAANKQFTRYHLQLVTGTSAFVSIVDPRLRAFSSDSISRDSTVPIRTDTIEKLLRAQLLRHMKYYQSNSNQLMGRNNNKGRKLPKNLHPNALPASNRAVHLAEEEEKGVRLQWQKAFQFDGPGLQRQMIAANAYANAGNSSSNNHNNSGSNRSYENAIPPSILSQTLFQEINHHFMEIISESD